MVHPDAAVFAAEWLTISVVRDRFQAGTRQEAYYEPLRDLVINVLELLSHTPLVAVGLNCDFHYRLESQDAWNNVGDRLAPKEIWRDLLEKPGTASITMQGVRQDDLAGYVQVKVEPSKAVQHGVYVDLNDHYQLAPADQAQPAALKVIQFLSERWSETIQKGLAIAEAIVDLGGPR